MIKRQSFKNSNNISPRKLLGFIVAAIVTFLLTVSVVGIASKYFRIRRELNVLKSQRDNLSKKEEVMKEKNYYLTTPEGIEQELREKYNVAKPGEGVIILNNQVPHQEGVGQSQSDNTGLWTKILKGLGLGK